MNESSKRILQCDFSADIYTPRGTFYTNTNLPKEELKWITKDQTDKEFWREFIDAQQSYGSSNKKKDSPYTEIYVNRKTGAVESPMYGNKVLTDSQVANLINGQGADQKVNGPIRYDRDDFVKLRVPNAMYLNHYRLGGKYSKYRNKEMNDLLTGERVKLKDLRSIR